MARARNIKPAFFENDELAELPPLTRLYFIGLWTLADFKGCLEYRPKRIKAQIFPYDDCDIDAMTSELMRTCFIKRYYQDGQTYLKVTNFVTHQRPHKNEVLKGSNIPDYTQYADLTKENESPNNSVSKPHENVSHPPDTGYLIPDTGLLNADTQETVAIATDYVSFDVFWNIYPKKVGKAAAQKKWDKLKPSPELFTLITNHLRMAYVNTEKQFIPNATTYLNQERWNDEVITHGQAQPKPSLVERVAAQNAERERQRQSRESHGQAMAEAAGNIRAPTGECVRGNDAGELGAIIDGCFSRSDSDRPE